ncbi:MAG: FAD:protein FMN transferase [Candidatus Omnitrophica bacterium]|nr:FAD:protein FMN transferase [Candidatus Omnitrophota bacterium]MCM8801745.1 FAD:protein FMN transferase [Candidatus Omnitrophota bacterium]
MKNKIFIFFLIKSILCFPQKENFINRTEFLLDTIFNIQIERVENSDTLLNQAFELVKKLEDKLSIFKEDSEVSKLNKYKRYKVSNEVLEVIKKSIYISKITDGAFDITCKKIIDLYKHKSKQNILPTEKEINKVLKETGWKKIKIKENEIFLSDLVEIDLGGIAKGFIVDKVADFLKSKGVKNGIINAGGDIYCWGTNQRNKKWRIGIENPFEAGKIIRSFETTEKGIATSGNYKRYIDIKEKKIGHIINPKTGLPIESSVVSVTVIAPDCMTADGLATGIFVLGIENGLNLVNNLKDIECLIIEKNKKIYKSKNFFF